MGRNRQTPPEQGAGDHRGAERGTVSPGRSPAAPVGLPPSPHRRPRSSAPPPLPYSAAPGPVLPPRCGRALRAKKRPSSPVPDAQSRGSKKKVKKDAEKGTLLWLGLSTPRNPPKVPSSRRRRPAGRGHSGQPGRGGRARGPTGRPPGAECPLVPRRKPGAPGVGLSSAPGPFLLAPRQPCSSQLLSAPLPRRLDERSASAPPTPPAPPPEAPPTRPPRGGGGGRRAAGAESLACCRTWSACRPRPGPNQASRGGVSPRRGGRKRRAPHLPGPEEGRERQKGAVWGPLRSRPFPTRRNLEGTLSASPFWPNGPLRRSAPAPLARSLPKPSRAGRGWLFGLSRVLLIRNDGVEATQRGGDPSGGGFVTPSFSPVLLSRTHRPTHHSGRRALVGFMLDGGRRQEAKPSPLTLVSAIVKEEVIHSMNLLSTSKCQLSLYLYSPYRLLKY
ncbi:basic proline-rich protein-like [Ailuropoda melanoleuca]|uniref:basic proline-rich protein-like n=1 Tax=Ailuropoda melanoleuca TaxID=9646 RepID=UPI0014942100|nr:basic proline-rich protein-like [Ailuropoda melanoleuca]